MGLEPTRLIFLAHRISSTAPYQFEHLTKAEYVGLEPTVWATNPNKCFQDTHLRPLGQILQNKTEHAGIEPAN